METDTTSTFEQESMFDSEEWASKHIFEALEKASVVQSRDPSPYLSWLSFVSICKFETTSFTNPPGDSLPNGLLLQ